MGSPGIKAPGEDQKIIQFLKTMNTFCKIFLYHMSLPLLYEMTHLALVVVPAVCVE